MSKEQKINLDANAENVYQIAAKCRNCGTEQTVKIPYTITVEEYNPACYMCLCRTLQILKNRN